MGALCALWVALTATCGTCRQCTDLRNLLMSSKKVMLTACTHTHTHTTYIHTSKLAPTPLLICPLFFLRNSLLPLRIVASLSRLLAYACIRYHILAYASIGRHMQAYASICLHILVYLAYAGTHMQACASFYVPTLQCPQEGLSSLHGPLQGISSDFQALDPTEGKHAQERTGMLWRAKACWRRGNV